MWLLSISLVASLVHCTLAQDCVECLTVPCSSPDASDSIWTTCLSCLQRGYPLLCTSQSTCALALLSAKDELCNCANIAATLVQGLQLEVPPCDAPPPTSTYRSAIAAGTLPSVSSNGQPLQFIIPHMNFSSHGCFQTLNITLMEGISVDSTFYFQLWKRYIPISGQTYVVTNGLYQLNTSVPLTIHVSHSNMYSLPLNICFYKGDTIGIQLPSNSLLRIATDNSSVIYKRDIPAHCTDVLSRIFQPSLSYTGSPLFTLITAPSPSSPTLCIIPSSSLPAATYQSISSHMSSSSVPLMQTHGAAHMATVVSSSLPTLIIPVSITVGVVVIFVLLLLTSTVAVLCLHKKEDVVDSTHAQINTIPSGNQLHAITSFTQQPNLLPEQQVTRVPDLDHLSGLPSLLEESSECSRSTNAMSPHPYEVIRNAERKADVIYDHPRELELRPMPLNIYHTLETSTRPFSEIASTMGQTRDETILSHMTSTTISSSEESLASENTNQQPKAKTQLYHVLENTERDPETGNRYHVLEEQMRAQNGQSPKYGVYVPNNRQRERILQHGEQKWSQVSRTKIEKDKKFFQDKGQFWEPASDDVILYEQLSKHRFREILREDIIVSDQLGSGAFGTVYKAQWNFPGGKLGVAVKVMKPSIAQGSKVKFLQEAAVMGQFFHPNVVKLHGVVTIGEPPMIVLELMPRGDLASFLRNYHTPGERPPPTPTFLLLCSRDIACGMKYLSYKGFVHRDLAARNILLTEDLKCKIGDFGLSRDLDENPYYITHKGTIPLKWSAPEAFMYGKFSTSSDVYSYGMLLYEIWSCGCKPMADVGMEEAKRLLIEGYCQPPPPGCPRGVYEVMVQCWNPQHTYRPSFAEIQEYLGASDDTILAWSSSDKEISPLASVLGAPLSEGAELYKNLQQSYRQLQITPSEKKTDV